MKDVQADVCLLLSSVSSVSSVAAASLSSHPGHGRPSDTSGNIIVFLISPIFIFSVSNIH